MHRKIVVPTYFALYYVRLCGAAVPYEVRTVSTNEFSEPASSNIVYASANELLEHVS